MAALQTARSVTNGTMNSTSFAFIANATGKRTVFKNLLFGFPR
uniref:Uncharacterized protein n=1 Tax=Anguilla anguilla TaxID=7936 RepID=A0A0E9PFF3_ANGAN